MDCRHSPQPKQSIDSANRNTYDRIDDLAIASPLALAVPVTRSKMLSGLVAERRQLKSKVEALGLAELGQYRVGAMELGQ